ncbi:putative F-box domain-containing protein [Helianthus debilis subsp. tardiflorus]
METLEDEQPDDRSAQKAKNSFPEELIEDILSRLPVKSILRFKSVSKPWLSLISAPSFHNLHSTVAPRTTAFFFTARDSSTNTRYFFSGARDGGSAANLMKLDNTVFDAAHKFAEHLNGLEAPEAISTTNSPFAQLVKINGLLGVACYDSWTVNGRKKMDIWMLQDYQNRVWVRETIRFASKSQIHYGYLFDSITMDEIIFSARVLSESLISVPIYNMKTRCFKSIELTLGHRFLSPKSVRVEEIKCYVESLIPLQN